MLLLLISPHWFNDTFRYSTSLRAAFKVVPSKFPAYIHVVHYDNINIYILQLLSAIPGIPAMCVLMGGGVGVGVGGGSVLYSTHVSIFLSLVCRMHFLFSSVYSHYFTFLVPHIRRF